MSSHVRDIVRVVFNIGHVARVVARAPYIGQPFRLTRRGLAITPRYSLRRTRKERHGTTA